MKTFGLFVCLVVFATMVDAKPALLVSKKQRFSIVVNPPVGWNGPAYTAAPSYETWSLGKGKDADSASYIEIRIDPVRGPKLNLNTATAEQVKKTFDDFTNPEVAKIADVIIGEIPVVIWAVHNVDGELLIADLRHGGCDFHFSLRANSAKELRRYEKTFLDVVKSIQILPKKHE